MEVTVQQRIERASEGHNSFIKTVTANRAFHRFKNRDKIAIIADILEVAELPNLKTFLTHHASNAVELCGAHNVHGPIARERIYENNSLF